MTPPIQSSQEKTPDETQSQKSIQTLDSIIDIEPVGTLTNREGTITLLRVVVRNGRCGKVYVLVSPDIRSIVSQNESFLTVDSSSVLGLKKSFQKLHQGQKILLKEGGVIIHFFDQESVVMYHAGKASASDQLSESALILRVLGFPKGYRFLLIKRTSDEIKVLTAAGFSVVEY